MNKVRFGIIVLSDYKEGIGWLSFSEVSKLPFELQLSHC